MHRTCTLQANLNSSLGHGRAALCVDRSHVPPLCVDRSHVPPLCVAGSGGLWSRPPDACLVKQGQACYSFASMSGQPLQSVWRRDKI